MKRGTAAMTICSTAFVRVGTMQCKALGMPHLPILVIEHPFGSRPRAEVGALAEQCAEQIARLTGESALS